MTSLSVREFFGSIPGLVKSCAVTNAGHRCDVSVLPIRLAAEIGPDTRYTLRRNTMKI